MKSFCPFSTQKKGDHFLVTIHCQQCKNGQLSFFNSSCRKQIFSLLQQFPEITQLIFHQTFIQVYQDKTLTYLQELAWFNEEKQLNKTIQKEKAYTKESMKKEKQESIDIFTQFQQYRKQKKDYDLTMKKQARKKTPFLHQLPENLSSSSFFHDYLRPYVRPGFIDSYLQLKPPVDAVFESTYPIESYQEKQATVRLYSRNESPEKLYFLHPFEYQLSQADIHILETIRSNLARHQPTSSSFIDTQNTRVYFKRFAKQIITEENKKKPTNKKVNSQKISILADMFAQYTAGFGIIEDLLNDPHIQDIYVNAPVQNNPLHLVLDGEEYTSNIFLSAQDVEALSSRFRCISGRPFSEATPVLDMDLPLFHTRIAAIGQPLTPKGTAFALRRHRKKPWTLSHFIANKMLSSEAAGLLSFLVDGQASLLIAGSRGAGKTSLLSALLLEIPQRYRILSIEDTSEIPVSRLQELGYKLQSLLTKSIASSADSTELSPTDVLRTALRLGESVLIIGEVRGVEAKVLFEAMRVGAAGNLIMGTIHGSSPIDIFERIVFDIGVPTTSFKAVDAVVVAAPIRSKGGVGRKRRVTEISETVKHAWTPDITGEDVFQPLMVYDSSTDMLQQQPRITIGQSTIIQQIAKRWGITVEQALSNIQLRTHIKKQLVQAGTKNNPQFLEAVCNRDANNHLWMLIEQAKQDKKLDYKNIEAAWDDWFMDYMKRRTV